MPLSPGSRLGVYEIVSPIGAGGMGEVYRAHDTKLGRDVAVKILPDVFANDPERRGRFEREARTLAALNHPNIAQIYGFEQAGDTLALAMELVEGETLDARLKASAPRDGARGLSRAGLPIAEAIAIARQITDALEAAHEQGIVHRDLKPANIKVRDDGTVKVLDFGLAKAVDPTASSNAAAMNSPTLTAHATVAGVILGTAAYMSPEQARGKAVDRRADIWAFGALLYEMLAGKRAFAGEEISDTLASVLKEDPDWSALPPDLAASLRRVLRRCLEKNPRNRLSAIGDARLELNERDDAAAGIAPMAARPRTRAWQAAIVVAAIASGSAATWVLSSRLRSSPPAALSRLSVLPPNGTTLYPETTSVALSPDGRTLALVTDFTSSQSPRLWLRPIDSVTARLLPGTDGASRPFWSPDGRYLGFFQDGKLKKINVEGARAEEICDAKDGRGGSWSSKGVIVFAPLNVGPLMQVPAGGGAPRAVTTLDDARGETAHRFPLFLPDGDHFLYVVLPARAGAFDIVVGSLSGAPREVLLAAQGTPAFVPPNQLVYMRKGTLLAQRFDPDRRLLAGDATALADVPSALPGSTGNGWVSASARGTIAYLAEQPVNTRLAWFDQAGRQTGNVAIPPGNYGQIALKRNGQQAVLTRRTSATFWDLWLVDLDRGGASRLADAPGNNANPVWSPDGERIAFSTNRDGPEDIFVKSVSPDKPEEPMFRSKAQFKRPLSWSVDGKYVVYLELGPETRADLFVITLADRRSIPYLRTPAYETFGTISPDGRWMAYVSDETGGEEVYVQTFPTPGGKHRISAMGASLGTSRAWWRQDGKQLLFVNWDKNELSIADVDGTRNEFSASPPRVVGHLPKGVVTLDVTPDLQRVLALVNEAGNVGTSITVVQNWRAPAR
jgi:serine/threonine protein kinase